MFDWSTFVVGAVGVAGIGGTILVARMTNKSQTADLLTSITAESDRVRKAEKRRIYAQFLGVSNDLRTKAIENARHPSDAAHRDYADSVASSLAALSEVRLIASIELWDLASQLGKLSVGRVDEVIAAEYFELENRVLDAMRADLGET